LAIACDQAVIPAEKKPSSGKAFISIPICVRESYRLSLCGKSVSHENDYAYIYDAIRLLAFELGVRFFADYLAGNVYFKVKHPEHNLARALVQFKLTESIESQETTIRNIIQDMK
jgi:hypothetical protein